MNQKTVLTIKKIYKIIFSALTLVMGVLLILQTLNIYIEGTEPGFEGQMYSREIVGEKLAAISPVLIAWLIGMLAGIILWCVFPDADKQKLTLPPEFVLWRLKGNMPRIADSESESVKAINSRETTVTVVRTVCAAIAVAVSVYFVIYLATPENFPGKNVTGEVLDMAGAVFPPILAAFVAFIAASLYERYTAKAQIEHVKRVIAEHGKASNRRDNFMTRLFYNKYFVFYARIAVAAVGAVFVVIGVLNGGMRDVFVKAINICTECIGLG